MIDAAHIEMLADIWAPSLVQALRPLILAQKDGREAIRRAWHDLPDDARCALGSLVAQGRLPMLTQPAFIVPILSPEACRVILDRSSAWTFSPNPLEEPAYQIPEAILSACDPDLEAMVRGWLVDALAPILMAIWGRMPDHYASIQLASYRADQAAESSIHIDYDADYTAVIALNEGFEGGGTLLLDGLLGELPVPALPPGYALIFPGRRLAHRGLPVTSGERMILTVWMNDDGARW